MQSVTTHPSHNFDGGVNMLLTWINLSLSCNVTARGTFYWYISDVIKGVMASQITSVTCLLNRLFMRISNKTSKLRVTGVCEGNSPMTDDFPAQRASNAENVSICFWLNTRTLTTPRAVKLHRTLQIWTGLNRDKHDCGLRKCYTVAERFDGQCHIPVKPPQLPHSWVKNGTGLDCYNVIFEIVWLKTKSWLESSFTSAIMWLNANIGSVIWTWNLNCT